jgi:plastocyanin
MEGGQYEATEDVCNTALAIVVLVFAAVAVAQSSPEGLDANGNTTGVEKSTTIPGEAPVESTIPAESKAPTQSEPPLPNSSVTVDIHDHTFDPAQLDVAPGTTVTWTNGDTEAYTVTADNGLFYSGAIEPRQSYSTWLGGSGTVSYHCEVHPDMKGSVVVGGGVSGGGETSTGDPASSTPARAGASMGDPASNPSTSQEQLAEYIDQLPIYSPPA